MPTKTTLSLLISSILSAPVLADTSYSLDEISVTATRSQQQLEDLAASVTVISDDDIERQMSTGIENIFDYTPGVSVEGEARQGIQSINIRGMEGNRIKILLDGVSQANQFSNGSYSFINSGRVNVDTDLLKSAEVVKGAASSLQGSDAIGGIVAFTTKDPEDFLQGRDMGGHVKLAYSSSDHSFHESVALANRFGELETLVAYTRRDGNEVDNFGQPDQQDYAKNNLLVKLQYQLNAAHRLEFTADYVNNSTDTQFNDESYTDYTGDDNTEQTRIGLKHLWDSELKLADQITWQLDWLSKEERGLTHRTTVNGFPPYTPPTGNKQTKDYVYKDQGIQFDLQLDKAISTATAEHYIVYGLALSDKDIENTNHEFNSHTDDQTIFYVPEAREQRYGVFIQDEISINNWLITPGLRYDAFNTKPGDVSDNPSGNDPAEYQDYSDSALTGRLGAVYSLNEQHKLFAQISQGFRAPDFQELYYSYGNPMHGYITIPNPELEAEESIAYELGWRHSQTFSQSEVAIFYSDYDNFIDQRWLGGAGTPSDPLISQSINIDKATIKGAELSNSLSWDQWLNKSGFSSQVAVAYTEGEDDQGNPINSINPWNAVVGLHYDAPSRRWGSSLRMVYNAAKKAEDIYTEDGEPSILPMDSSTVLDLTAYYIPIEDLTLRAGIFNITDEEYYQWNDVRGISEENKDLTQAGRNVSLNVKYDF